MNKSKWQHGTILGFPYPDGTQPKDIHLGQQVRVTQGPYEDRIGTVIQVGERQERELQFCTLFFSERQERVRLATSVLALV